MHLVTYFSSGHIMYESIYNIDNIRSSLPRDPPWNRLNTISTLLSVPNKLSSESLFSISQVDSFPLMSDRTFSKNQHFSLWKTPLFSLINWMLCHLRCLMIFFFTINNECELRNYNFNDNILKLLHTYLSCKMCISDYLKITCLLFFLYCLILKFTLVCIQNWF